MVKMYVDGSGNVGTTQTTSAGTLTFGTTQDMSLLNAEIDNQKRMIENQQKRLDLQEQKILQLTRDLRLARASNSGNNLGFTKEELNFILSKVHPDKNPNSKLSPELTKKIIDNRKK